jgi:hypothetical protein
MNSQIKITIKDVKPLTPMILELKEEGKEEYQMIVFLNQMNGDVYDEKGKLPETFSQGIVEWIQEKEKEMVRKIQSGLVQVTPEQARMMGLDMDGRPSVSPGGIIL